MATNPNQTSEDLTTPSPYVPTHAEIQHRLTQLRKPSPTANTQPATRP